MYKTEVKVLRRFLINGKQDKVFEVLIDHLEGKDADLLNNVILLY